jgi:hypothetical protein
MLLFSVLLVVKMSFLNCSLILFKIKFVRRFINTTFFKWGEKQIKGNQIRWTGWPQQSYTCQSTREELNM